MKKWLYLLAAFICWVAIGFLMFDFLPAQSSTKAGANEQISRIISTAPNITEILFALGLEERITAVTSDSTYPAPATTKQKIGNFWQPDIEAIIAAKPDLIVTLGFPLYPQQQNLADRLRRFGYNSLTVFHTEGVSDLFDAIEQIGSATQRQQQAKALAADIKQKLDRIGLLVAEKKKVRVLYIVQRNPLRVAGRDTFINEMIELAGGENAIGPTIQKYPPIGSEQFIACNTDVIIEPTMGQENPELLEKNALQFWSKFENVPAVKNKRVYVVADDAISQLGPRVAEGVETIARCLRPELFEN